jgi:uncharacterized phage protein gp47/JayE
MPFARPTLSDLVEEARAELNRLPGADSRLRRSLLDVLARIVAAAVWGIYGFGVWILSQVFEDTAEAEQLERKAAIWGLPRIAATFASGSIDLVGEDGTVVSEATRFRRADGVEFDSTADATIASGTAVVPVTAVLPGETGNCDAGMKLSFLSPVAGAANPATVHSGGITGGGDQETDEALRTRLLQRIRTPPHGGSFDDYDGWARAALVGVTRVWVTSPNPGEVLVLFVMDGGGGAGGIIPSVGQIAVVQDYIDDFGRRPVTASVAVDAPTTTAVAFTIDLGTNDTSAIRAAVSAELVDLFRRESSPGGTILLSHIREAISGAAGEVDHVLTVPSANVVLSANHIPILGTITWV